MKKDKSSKKDKEKKKKEKKKNKSSLHKEQELITGDTESISEVNHILSEIEHGSGESEKDASGPAGKAAAHKGHYVNHKHLLSHSHASELEHAKMVSSLAYEVALEMGLPDKWADDMIIAGYFHDIGKSILAQTTSNESKLVVEEMNALRIHPMIGYEELEASGYNRWICDSVRWHHENKDGSGYPDGLKDGEIPLGACILRVCDVFCALVQDREYRKAFSPEQAVSIMVDEVEKYDIRAFLAFQRVIHRNEDGSVQVPPVSPRVEEVWKELQNETDEETSNRHEGHSPAGDGDQELRDAADP